MTLLLKECVHSEFQEMCKLSLKNKTRPTASNKIQLVVDIRPVARCVLTSVYCMLLRFQTNYFGWFRPTTDGPTKYL